MNDGNVFFSYMSFTTLVYFGGRKRTPKSTMVFSPEETIEIVLCWYETKSYTAGLL